MKLAKAIAAVSFFLFQTHVALAQGIGGGENNETDAGVYGGTFQPILVEGYVLSPIATRRCGGHLIYYDIVLTAAHCEKAFPVGERLLISPYTTGIYNEERYVAEFIKHPQFGGDANPINDIALVRLDNPSFQYVGNWGADTNRPGPNEKVTILGFGLTNGEQVSENMLQATTRIEYNSNCASYSSWFRGESQFCTIESPYAIGKGDSGGPVFPLGNYREILGVNSYGNGKYSAMTRVSYFNQWIKDNLCNYSKYASNNVEFSGCPPPPPPPPTSPPKRRALSSLPRELTGEEWSNMKGVCSTMTYKAFLSINGLHFAVIAVPDQDGNNDNNDQAECSSFAFHAMYGSGEDSDENTNTLKKLVHQLEDEHRDKLIGEGGVSREVEGRTFFLSEIAEAFDQAEVGGNSYDIVSNNCATLPISMAMTVGVEIDQSWMDFVSTRLLLEKETLAQYIRGSPDLHRLLSGFGRLRKLVAAPDSDKDLVNLLANSYMKYLTFRKRRR